MTSRVTKYCILTVFAVLLLGQLVKSAPSYGDLDGIAFRDLYEILRNEIDDRRNHQVVRKAGRDPSLRLRFGRRSDPLWSQFGPEETQAEGTAAN